MSLLSRVDVCIVFGLVSVLKFLLSLCPVPLLSCVDNYVVFPLVSVLVFYCHYLCPVSLLSSVNVYIVFMVEFYFYGCASSYIFSAFMSCVIVISC